jgi:hypothetical protein
MIAFVSIMTIATLLCVIVALLADLWRPGSILSGAFVAIAVLLGACTIIMWAHLMIRGHGY